MKNIITFLVIMVMSAGMCSTIFADQVTITGNLTKKITETNQPADIVIPANCGNPARTITFAVQTTEKYIPYIYNAGTNITFEVHSQKPGASNPVYTTNTTMNNISYDQVAPLDGSFSYTLNNAAIAPSRYNYTCKVYVGSETSPAFEKDFNVSSSGAVFPVGSVIAYMGNSTTIAALAESGWYKCAGQTVTSLSALTADEQTALTNIVGSTLPDLRGVFLRGLDESRGYDDNAGSRTGGEGGNGVRSYQQNSVQSLTYTTTVSGGAHHHTVSPPSDHGWMKAGSFTGGNVTQNGTWSNVDATSSEPDLLSNMTFGSVNTSSVTPSMTASTTASGDGAETRPENVAVYWLMRCR